MKLHLQTATRQNLVSAYGAGFVAINGERLERSLIITPDSLRRDWSATSFAALRDAHFVELARIDCEILLLGTGKRLQFPPHSLTRAIHEARIGLEIMDTHAACRTYNILMGEGRKVAAALVVE